jgi:CRP-like cAMP-binding protein
MSFSSNSLLASLSSADIAAFEPHMKRIRLEPKRVLYEQGSPINAVYFPVSAVISIVVSLSTGETIEAAMLGKDASSARPLPLTAVSRSAGRSFKWLAMVTYVTAVL